VILWQRHFFNNLIINKLNWILIFAAPPVKLARSLGGSLPIGIDAALLRGGDTRLTGGSLRYLRIVYLLVNILYFIEISYYLNDKYMCFYARHGG
jgi:hypothetical protein